MITIKNYKVINKDIPIIDPIKPLPGWHDLPIDKPLPGITKPLPGIYPE